MIKYILLVIVWVFAFNLNAQNENEIAPVEIKVVKDYNVFIEEASKIYSPIHYYPKFKDKTLKQKLNYEIPDRIEQFKFEPSSIEPLVYHEKSKLYNSKNFIKLGFGSALNPLLEWSHIGTNQSKPYKIHLFHHSSWIARDSFQKYSETKGEFSFQKKIKNWTLIPGIVVQHKYCNFYGNLSESGYKGDANRNYGNVTLNIDLNKEEIAPKKLSVRNQFKTFYGIDKIFISDSNYDHNESNISLSSDLNYKYNESLKINLQGGGQFYHYKFDTFTDKWIINLMPNGEFRTKSLKISGGLNFVQSITNSQTSFHIFPHFVSEVKLIPGYLNFYTLWSRNLELNTLKATLGANPFTLFSKEILPNTTVENRTAGLKAMYQNLSCHAFFNQRLMKNAILFKNDATNPRFMFSSIEKNMTVNNIGLELSYLKEKLGGIYLKGDIFLYEFDTIMIANNLPGQKLSLGINAQLLKNLTVNLSTFAIGGLKSNISGKEITQPIQFDLNMGCEFHISKNFYIFANANNILNSQFSGQVGYPTIGVNGQGGIRYCY